jgi:hypothetical protein
MADSVPLPMTPWADPQHPSNKIRPRVRCAGCGCLGCVTHWGPWCFDCNVKRMTRLSASFAEIEASLQKETDNG